MNFVTNVLKKYIQNEPQEVTKPPTAVILPSPITESQEFSNKENGAVIKQPTGILSSPIRKESEESADKENAASPKQPAIPIQMPKKQWQDSANIENAAPPNQLLSPLPSPNIDAKQSANIENAAPPNQSLSPLPSPNIDAKESAYIENAAPPNQPLSPLPSPNIDAKVSANIENAPLPNQSFSLLQSPNGDAQESPNKKNAAFQGNKPDVGFSRKEKPHIRRSVLKAFDPLYDSPVNVGLTPRKHSQQTFVEVSDPETPRSFLDLNERHEEQAYESLFSNKSSPLIHVATDLQKQLVLYDSDESYLSTETSPRESPNPEKAVAANEPVLLDDSKPLSTSNITLEDPPSFEELANIDIPETVEKTSVGETELTESDASVEVLNHSGKSNDLVEDTGKGILSPDGEKIFVESLSETSKSVAHVTNLSHTFIECPEAIRQYNSLSETVDDSSPSAEENTFSITLVEERKSLSASFSDTPKSIELQKSLYSVHNSSISEDIVNSSKPSFSPESIEKRTPLPKTSIGQFSDIQGISNETFAESPISELKKCPNSFIQESPKSTEKQKYLCEISGKSPKPTELRKLGSNIFVESPKFSDQHQKSSPKVSIETPKSSEPLSESFTESPKLSKLRKSVSENFVENPKALYLTKSFTESFYNSPKATDLRRSLSETFVKSPELAEQHESFSKTSVQSPIVSVHGNSFCETIDESSKSSAVSIDSTSREATEVLSSGRFSQTIENSAHQLSFPQIFTKSPKSTESPRSLNETPVESVPSPKISTVNTSLNKAHTDRGAENQESDDKVFKNIETDSLDGDDETALNLECCIVNSKKDITQGDQLTEKVSEEIQILKNNPTSTEIEGTEKYETIEIHPKFSENDKLEKITENLKPLNPTETQESEEKIQKIETEQNSLVESKLDNSVEKEYLDSGIESIEESFTKTSFSRVDDFKHTAKELKDTSEEVSPEDPGEKLNHISDTSDKKLDSCEVNSSRKDFKIVEKTVLVEEPKTGTIENFNLVEENITQCDNKREQIELEIPFPLEAHLESNEPDKENAVHCELSETVDLATVVNGFKSSEQKGGDSESTTNSRIGGDKSIPNKPIDPKVLVAKMADLSERLSEQQQENSNLKLQLNASQQAKATLELEIRQKEEIIIKTQAEALKNEQVYKQELKQLKEKLKEKSKLIEKDGSKELEEQLKEAKAREAKAIAELNQRNKDDLNYQKIMDEYENTIAARLSEFQKLKEEHATASHHLANLELAFSDVHKKYERTKSLLEGFKSNEEALSLSLQASEKTCKQHEERYESLKAHAKAQIEKSNKEILMLRDKYEMDINKLKAIIKRLEIKCSSLEVSLQQKTEECAALSALCDEVTGKRV